MPSAVSFNKSLRSNCNMLLMKRLSMRGLACPCEPNRRITKIDNNFKNIFIQTSNMCVNAIEGSKPRKQTSQIKSDFVSEDKRLNHLKNFYNSDYFASQLNYDNEHFSAHVGHLSSSKQTPEYFLDEHMPDFALSAKLYYSQTKRLALKRIIHAFYGSEGDSSDNKSIALCIKMMREHPNLIYSPMYEIEQCFKIFSDWGVLEEELLEASFLLLEGSSSLLARNKLFQELGLQCRPSIGLIRLQHLMEVQEQELVARGLLPSNRSLTAHLLSVVGEDHVANSEDLLRNASPQAPIKYSYYSVLAGFLAHRFGVSSSDTQRVLSSYRPSYKPLSHYYIICDLLERKLGADFHQIAANPQLLDVSPIAALSLLSRHPIICGRPTPHIICSHPSLTHGSPALLSRWLHLLAQYKVESFPLTPLVLWVLKQDFLDITKLVLEYLPSHSQWEAIKTSPYLFEIFIDPSVTNKLVNKNYVFLTRRSKKSSSSSSCSSNLIEKSEECSSANITSPQSTLYSRLNSADSSAYNNKKLDYVRASAAKTAQVLNRLMGPDGAAFYTGEAVDVHYISPKWKNGPSKFRPPREVAAYLRKQLGATLPQLYRMGWVMQNKCSLLDVTSIMHMLAMEGFTKEQMLASLPIFAADRSLVKEQLEIFSSQDRSYVEYWRRHPNGVNLILYLVRKCGLSHDQSLQDAAMADDDEDSLSHAAMADDDEDSLSHAAMADDDEDSLSHAAMADDDEDSLSQQDAEMADINDEDSLG
ncbi:uncharacterized protein LOC108666731 isoform X3 [Hyalella azteca]|uniref:Uncharacterized protein LOC108666731 isoform X3 n=1 Tax=Hyalella azteca TaxID=294128 RepID=A0A979FGI2_HYAAZ|nr:uncharacterized protein LOC108666731 isoform X3 [Hyalella azteca]